MHNFVHRARRFVVLVVAASIYGCASTPANVSFNNSVAISDTTVRFEQCGVSVRFRGYPRQITPQELTDLTRNLAGSLKWDVVGYGFDEPRLAEVAVCTCRDAVFGARDMEQFRALTQEGGNNKFIALLNSSYSQYILRYEAANSLGEMIDRIQFAFPTVANRCIFMQNVWSEKSNIAASTSFFDTARGAIGEARKPETAPLEKQGGKSIEERLDQLMKLRNLNLISQEEYDRKRKVIIDGL